MKKNKLINIHNLYQKIEEKYLSEIIQELEFSKTKIPNIFKIITNKWFKLTFIIFIPLIIILFFILWIKMSHFFLLILLFIFLIGEAMMLFVYFFNLKKGNWLNYANIDYEKIYENTFKTLNKNISNFHFSNKNNIISDINKTKTWLKNIPINAKIINKTPMVEFTINNNKFAIQIVKFHWQTRDVNNKTTRNYYQDFGLMKILIDSNNPMSKNFSFSIGAHSISIFDKKRLEDLENKNFVKLFKPISNDPIKTRMTFTILTMEEMLENYHRIISKPFIMQKENEIFLMPFIPSNDKILITNYDFIKYAKEETKFIAKKIIEDIVQDIYEVYLLVDYSFYPKIMND